MPHPGADIESWMYFRVLCAPQRIHLRKADRDSWETSRACGERGVERGLRPGRIPEGVSLSGGSVLNVECGTRDG